MAGVAIVGSGEQADRHRETLQRVPGIDLVAVAAPTDSQDLLERADVQAIDVCAPGDQQVAIGVAAARAGKDVLVEQLLAASLAEADRLIAACREAGVTLTVLRPAANQPIARALKTAVDEGRIGTLRYVHFAAIGSGDSAAGTPLVDQASGALDLVRSLFGVPVSSVFARACSLDGPGSPPAYVSVVLSFADASQAICEIGRGDGLATGTGLQRIALSGQRGSAYYDIRDSDVILGANGVRVLADDPGEGLVAALTTWAAGSSRGSGVDEGRATLRVALAAGESVRTGQPVEVGG